MSEQESAVLKVTADNFQSSVLESDKPVLVDFFADWCGPCQALTPVVEDLATEYEGRATIAKVDVDKSGAIAQQYGVQSIPTLVFLQNGQVVDRWHGVLRFGGQSLKQAPCQGRGGGF